MDKAPPACLLCIALLFLAGCTTPPPQTGAPENNGIGANVSSPTNASPLAGYRSYAKSTRSFYIFTDPKEGAFSLEVPNGWAVSQGSGIIRPYIDAGVAFEAKSPSGQGFFLQEPYGYIYVTPNAILNYTGFAEGSLYGPSGGIAKPMMVKKYALASDFITELVEKSGLNVSNLEVTDRPDLLAGGDPLISQQSSAEADFEYEQDGKRIKSVIAVRTTLLEMSGTGIWFVAVMEHYAPAGLLNETELLALNMQRSFKVNGTWAAQEQREVQKRLGIIAQSQSDIGETISSTFEMRSRTMDELNHKWDNYILGVQDVYDPATGSHYVVDSGSAHYWLGPRGEIYGTDIAESPRPMENLQQLTCPGC